MMFSDFKTTVANRIDRWVSVFDRMPSRIVGIDIGVDSVSVVSLGPDADLAKRRATQSSLQWRSVHRFDTQIDPMTQLGPEWIAMTVRAIAERLPRCVDGEENVAMISLPIPWVHHQVVVGTELTSAKSQCDAMFTNSLFQSDSFMTHWPVVGLQHGSPNEDDQYMIAAIANDAACHIAQAVSDIGYTVQNIMPQGVALVEAAKPLTAVDPQCVVMLNRTGGLAAMNNGTGCGLCRSLPAIPVQVMRDFANRRMDVHSLRPWLSDVAAEINATIRFSNRANMCGRQDKPLLVCGDLFDVDGVDVVLAKLTNLPIAVWSYCGRVRPDRRMTAESESTSVATSTSIDPLYALGLSLAYQGSQTSRPAPTKDDV